MAVKYAAQFDIYNSHITAIDNCHVSLLPAKLETEKSPKRALNKSVIYTAVYSRDSLIFD